MVNVRANFLFVIFDGEFEGCSRIGNSPRNLQLVLITRRQRDVGERQKVGGRVLATMGRTPRSTTRRINRLKSTIADLLQPAIFRPPTFWRSRQDGPQSSWLRKHTVACSTTS